MTDEKVRAAATVLQSPLLARLECALRTSIPSLMTDDSSQRDRLRKYDYPFEEFACDFDALWALHAITPDFGQNVREMHKYMYEKYEDDTDSSTRGWVMGAIQNYLRVHKDALDPAHCREAKGARRASFDDLLRAAHELVGNHCLGRVATAPPPEAVLQRAFQLSTGANTQSHGRA